MQAKGLPVRALPWTWAVTAWLGLLVADARAAGADDYREVVARTAGMVSDPDAQRLARARGLDVLNLTWEDTGRFKDSAVGPNISDMTIQVQEHDPRTDAYRLTCMPVIRFPNFADRSADVRPDCFFLLVGNEKGESLRRVSLWDFLGNVRKHLSRPASWAGDQTYLLAPRDSHVLVSAQACFLPVPKKGTAEFNPVLFNYQSAPDDPAVLAVLATREGTSATVIDNHRDGFKARGVWGQRLFFNHNGDRASFTGQRLSDFKATPEGGAVGEPATPEASGQKGLNMVLLIQVPLRQKPRARPQSAISADKDKDKAPAPAADKGGRRSDVEEAVIGHGKVEGPFTEMDNLPIERDPRFPIRVTVQFYKATSNGVVSAGDLKEIAEQIDKVYAQADYVGSLVTEGRTGRPTEYDGDKVQPPEWWEEFWKRYREERGLSRAEAVQELRKAHGPDWFPMTEQLLADEAEHLSFPDSRALGRLWPRTLYVVAGLGLALAVLAAWRSYRRPLGGTQAG